MPELILCCIQSMLIDMAMNNAVYCHFDLKRPLYKESNTTRHERIKKICSLRAVKPFIIIVDRQKNDCLKRL